MLKFENKAEIVNYIGGTVVRIVELNGDLLINPTLEQLKEALPGFSGDDEMEYTYKSKLGFGFTDFISNGGMKIVSEEVTKGPEFDASTMSPMEEVDEAKVTLVVEFEHFEESIVNNKTVKKAVKIRKLMSFRFKNHVSITSSGDKKEVYNNLGQTSYITADGTPSSEYFKNENVFDLPLGGQGLGFKELIDFIYSYAAQATGKVDLISAGSSFDKDINPEDMFEGDFSAIVDRFNVIHESLTQGDLKLYGALVLLTATDSNGRTIQTYYDKFERGVINDKGELNTTMQYIKNKVNKSRVPKAGKVYSPESKSILVGVNGNVAFGTREVKPSYMDFVAVAPITHTSTGLPPISSNEFSGIPDLPANQNFDF